MFRRYILSYFTATLFSVASSAQDIDSPEKNIINKNIPDTHRVDTLNILSRDLLFIDPIKSAHLASEALETSLKINYPIGQAYAYRILSSIYRSIGNDIIGADYLQRALNIFTTYGDSSGIANCYITMGHAFRKLQKRKEEVEYHKKSFEIFSRLKIPERIAVSAHNLGESYFITGEFQKSRELTGYAIKISNSFQYLLLLNNCNKVMGKLEFAEGNFKKAESYFKRELEVSKKLGANSQKTTTVESLIQLATINEQRGQKELQLAYLKDAAAFSEKYFLSDYLQTIYSALIKYYAGQKDQQQVLNYLAEYKRVSESVTAKRIKNHFELEQYAIQVYKIFENNRLKLEEENIINTNRIKTQNLFLLITLIFGIFLVGLIFILLQSLREQKKTKKQIKESEETFRGLVEQSLTGIYIIKDEKFTYINPQFTKIFGYSEEEMLANIKVFDVVYGPDQDLVRNTIEARLTGKTVSPNYSFRGIKKDGTIIFVEVFSASAMQAGHPITIGTLLDITDQHNAKEEIRKYNERFKLIASTTHDAIWEWDIEAKETWGNEMHQYLYGLTLADPLPTQEMWIQNLHPEDRETIVTDFNKTLASDKNVWIVEYRFKAKKGDYKNIYGRTYIVRDSNGKPTRIMGSMMDITKRKKIENDLRITKESYFSLMNNVDGIVWEADAITFDFSFVSKQAERLLGYPVEQWLTEPHFWANHIYEEDREWVVAYCIRCTLDKKSHEFEYRMVADDGRIIWLRDIVTVQIENEQPVKLTGLMVDITEAKKAEKAIRQSEEKYRSLIEQASEPIIIYSIDGTIHEFNTTACEMSGYTPDEFAQLRVNDILIGDIVVNKENYDALLEGNILTINRQVRKKDGTKLDLEIVARLIEDNKILAFGRDVTERKRIAKLIIKEKELSESIISNLPDIFYLFNKEGKFLRWNKNFEKVLGYSKKEIAAITPFDLFESSIRKPLLDKLKEIVQKGKIEFEGNFLSKEGKRIPYFFKGWKIHYEGNSCIIGIGVDITSRKKDEELLKKSYEDIRRLASHLEQVREEERIVIAREIHDELGQQLTVLKMDISWLDSKLTEKEDKVQKKMDDLMATIDNTVKTVRRISSELRPSILDDFGLIAAMEWHAQEFEKRSGVKTKFITKIEELKLPVNKSTSIYRIFQESLTNIARHAKASKASVLIEKKKNELFMTIRDDGGGFDPLAIGIKKTLGILGMRERTIIMGGEYFIESKIGKGTVTTIRIPVTNTS